MPTESFDLRALAAKLDRVGDDLKRAVAARAQTAATVMIHRVISAYPIGPVHRRRGQLVGGGTLRRSVGRAQPKSFAVTAAGTPVPAAIVRAGSPIAPHLHLYEIGTTLRETRRGASRGRMPAHPKPGVVFIPIAKEERAAMFRDVEALLARGGAL